MTFIDRNTLAKASQLCYEAVTLLASSHADLGTRLRSAWTESIMRVEPKDLPQELRAAASDIKHRMENIARLD